MNVLILDVETTISNKGNPFDQTNKLVCAGWKWVGENCPTQELYFPSNHEDYLYFQATINRADIIVGFNIKFDLHWLRRIDIDFSSKRIWDCQIAEFILGNQKNPYPSLNQACEKYGLPLKLDVVEKEYWSKGIDTDQVPQDILSEYLSMDLSLTEQVFLKQKEIFETDPRFNLFKLHCADLLVLEEMEWNGIHFNTNEARNKARQLEEQLKQIYETVVAIIGNTPINLNSDDHLSAILYGGSILDNIRVPIGVYKTGAKVGQPRYKIVVKEYPFPRLVEPLKGTEVKKPEGAPPVWKTNEGILRSLKLTKQAKSIVDLILEYRRVEKLSNTYLNGWSNLIDEMHWEKDTIHGNLNQCTVVTGRLSSTKPNLQNADPMTKIYCESRYV